MVRKFHSLAFTELRSVVDDLLEDRLGEVHVQAEHEFGPYAVRICHNGVNVIAPGAENVQPDSIFLRGVAQAIAHDSIDDRRWT